MRPSANPDPGDVTPGLCILVVEDEMMIAMMLEEMLTDFGCSVIKAARIAKAVPLAATEPIDGAILDLNLAGEPVYAVAHELRRRGIPFAFVSGYGSAGLSADYRGCPTLQKPFRRENLRRLVATFVPHAADTLRE